MRKEREMGVYLMIRGKKNNDREARKLNKLWIDFSEEEEEKEYIENFYGDKAGYTLHFTTDADNLLNGIYFRDKQGLDCGAKIGCRYDLEFYPSMTDEQAKRQYIKVFGLWSELAVCQLKLSGSHYCYHTLRKVKKFLESYKDILSWDDEDNGKNLNNYSDPNIWGEKILTSRYCAVCKIQASENGILLPYRKNDGCKNFKYVGPDSKIYNKLYEKILLIPDKL
jgi:hypothetical protein